MSQPYLRSASCSVAQLQNCTITQMDNASTLLGPVTYGTSSPGPYMVSIFVFVFCTAERVNAPISQSGVGHVSDVLVTAACQGQPDITALLEVSNVPVLPLNPLQLSLEMQIASLCQSVSLLINECRAKPPTTSPSCVFYDRQVMIVSRRSWAGWLIWTCGIRQSSQPVRG